MAADVGKSVFTVWTQLKYEHLLAGISGGILSTLVLHPLDLIKVRFQGKQWVCLISFPWSTRSPPGTFKQL